MAAPGKKKQPLPKRKGNPRVEALVARFSLDTIERRIVEVAYELERSLVTAEKMRKLGGLTVERLRAIAGDGVDAALSPKRALRRHALVAVGNGGMAAATDAVRLGPGLAARLDGAAEPDGLWLGTARILPGARGDVPARIAPVLAGAVLNGAAATLLTLDGCPRREAHELAAGLARHTGRGVLVVDGELLLDAADPSLLLACARREADCDGDVLVVCEVARLGERWRALLAPSSGTPAPLIVLADAERTREPVAAAPFSVRRLSLHPPAATTATSAPATASEPRSDDKPAPIDDGLDHVRKQAIRDAERALGIFRAPPPPPRAPVTPIPPPLAPRPTAAPTPAPAPTPTSPSRETKPAAEAAPPPRPTEPGKKRSSKGAQFFGGEATSAPPPPSAPPLPPLPAPPTVDPASLAGDGPPLPIPNDATPDDLARIATTSPSAAQRIELINRLRSIKSAAVVAALRANAASLHPGVRAAAEAAMAALFGPNWNATRAIGKPVQPPPGDDKDRGPPGGW